MMFFHVIVIIAILSNLLIHNVDAGLKKQLKRACRNIVKTPLKQAKNEVNRALNHVKKHEQHIVDAHHDKAIEIYNPQVVRGDFEFTASNQQEFLNALQDNGITIEKSQVLAQIAMDSLVTKSTEVNVWLPSQGYSFVQFLRLVTLRSNEDGKVKVKAIGLTASAEVKCERILDHRQVTRHIGNNHERKWTTTETRGITSEESNQVVTYLMNEIKKHSEALSEGMQRAILDKINSQQEQILN